MEDLIKAMQDLNEAQNMSAEAPKVIDPADIQWVG